MLLLHGMPSASSFEYCFCLLLSLIPGPFPSLAPQLFHHHLLFVFDSYLNVYLAVNLAFDSTG
jgi:hypothetical protein